MTIMVKLTTFVLLTLACCATAIASQQDGAKADLMPLAVVMPKLKAIHEDAKNLLIKNSELKAKILIGLQAQIEAKLKQVQAGAATSAQAPASQPLSGRPTDSMVPKLPGAHVDVINYSEMEEFNRWVGENLEYAVKNTQASMEALKEEAAQSNGNVDYSDQAIKDGIEGVKYWQSAVIFQDKTLNNEKFEID